MEGMCHYFGASDSFMQGLKYNDNFGDVEIVEFLEEEHTAIYQRAYNVLDLESPPWLPRCHVNDHGHVEKRCILRLACVKVTVRDRKAKCSISRRQDEQLMEWFGLRSARQLVTEGALICMPDQKKFASSRRQSFVLSSNKHFELSWTYDFTMNCTEAIWRGDEKWFQPPELIEALDYQRACMKHPMYLALAIATNISNYIHDITEDFHFRIYRVENRTRYSKYELVKASEAPGSYSILSKLMSDFLSRLAFCQAQSELLEEIIESIFNFQWPQNVVKPEWVLEVFNEVSDCIMVLRQRNKAHSMKIRYLSRRAKNQQNALFNIITQQETRLSISVAQDSRTLAAATSKDSTAMKTLAAVTVAFLPSTFVATFFSMPVFQWDFDKKTSFMVSGHFWVFWVISLPLTLLTLALWYAWTRLHIHRHHVAERQPLAHGQDDLDDFPPFMEVAKQDKALDADYAQFLGLTSSRC